LNKEEFSIMMNELLEAIKEAIGEWKKFIFY
jgi:hypothetical protein